MTEPDTPPHLPDGDGRPPLIVPYLAAAAGLGAALLAVLVLALVATPSPNDAELVDRARADERRRADDRRADVAFVRWAAATPDRDRRFAGFDLTDATLAGLDLAGADLNDAALAGADLHHADLRGASLRYADLRGTDLTNAQLDGADLTGIAHDQTTTWPYGYTPPTDTRTRPMPRPDVPAPRTGPRKATHD